MKPNVVNFPIIPRAAALAPEDDRDPHTAAIEMIKKAIQYSTQRCGKTWTLGVLQSALEIDDTNGWRERTRKMLQGSEKK